MTSCWQCSISLSNTYNAVSFWQKALTESPVKQRENMEKITSPWRTFRFFISPKTSRWFNFVSLWNGVLIKITTVVKIPLFSTVFNSIYDGFRTFWDLISSLPLRFSELIPNRDIIDSYCRYNSNLITYNQIIVWRNFEGKTSFCAIVQYSIC